MPNEKKSKNGHDVTEEESRGKVKFEVYGEEMVEKVVKLSGNSGRIYLPPEWLGCRVKIIRIDWSMVFEDFSSTEANIWSFWLIASYQDLRIWVVLL